MPRLMIIGQSSQALVDLRGELTRNGFTCTLAEDTDKIIEQITRQSPDLTLWEMNGPSLDAEIRDFIQKRRRLKSMPLVALVAREKLGSLNGQLEADDLLVSPYDASELILRIKRLLQESNPAYSRDVITCGGLVVDPDRCEVTVDGRIIDLTFKEYELLKFLASHPGRVYTRDVLLDKVWGYDYYGGDRTVDVHIRRLRSKIEDVEHSFIETVRNIGYRFRNVTPEETRI